MEASAADFGTIIQTVTLTAGQTQTVPFTIASNPASLTGTVTDTQTTTPLAGALVEVFVGGTTTPVKSTLTDDKGSTKYLDFQQAHILLLSQLRLTIIKPYL
ncbi:hypothetical protein [Priestia megaterium]|uniref:hypothetical protein n=1 Tax=Priestia megaterium TaxID=1404 RepID=UPI001EDAD252|nr:hypothetical protein [Priestia megaterium]